MRPGVLEIKKGRWQAEDQDQEPHVDGPCPRAGSGLWGGAEVTTGSSVPRESPGGLNLRRWQACFQPWR